MEPAVRVTESLPRYHDEIPCVGGCTRDVDAIQLFYETFGHIFTDIPEERFPWNFDIPTARCTDEITTFMVGEVKVLKIVEGNGWWETYIFSPEESSEIYIFQRYGEKYYDDAIPGYGYSEWIPVEIFSIRAGEGVFTWMVEFIEGLESLYPPISSLYPLN